MRRKTRRDKKKEKFIMLTSSLFVLSALTLTGIYVKERTKIQQENSVDFSKLENSADEKAEQIIQEQEEVEQANASKAINPKINSYENRYQYSGVPIVREETDKQEEKKEAPGEEESHKENDSQEKKQETMAQPSVSLHFQDEDALAWPIVGNILVNYSMDKTVYFATLEQYRYNPAIIIAATEGEQIFHAASGQVTKVYNDSKLGNCVSVDLGDGYELTYGQLKGITVKEGDFVEKGDLLGEVSAPTKYFSVEGANIYFALTKNKEPINPLNRLS